MVKTAKAQDFTKKNSLLMIPQQWLLSFRPQPWSLALRGSTGLTVTPGPLPVQEAS